LLGSNLPFIDSDLCVIDQVHSLPTFSVSHCRASHDHPLPFLAQKASKSACSLKGAMRGESPTGAELRLIEAQVSTPGPLPSPVAAAPVAATPPPRLSPLLLGLDERRPDPRWFDAPPLPRGTSALEEAAQAGVPREIASLIAFLWWENDE